MLILFLTLLTSLASTNSSSADSWINPKPSSVGSHVYAPPILSSEIFMSCYCPSFIASTGERIECKKGIEVLGISASSGNLAEITLKPNDTNASTRKKRKNNSKKKSSVFLNLVTAPVRATWYSISYLLKFVLGASITTNARVSEDSLAAYSIDLAKVNIAQEEDVRLFKNIYDQHLTNVKKNSTHDQHTIVLYGTSRGSATVFNFCALEKPKEVGAIVCEGLFDSLDHVYQTTSSLKTRLMINLIYRITLFKKDGILPIKLIKDIPHDIPILLVTSRKDVTVPWQCTMNIYSKLRQTGHDKVHILVLKNSEHGWYSYNDERKLYQNVVHAFYKHYSLPHIPEYAAEGWDYFHKQTQPAITQYNTWDWEA